MGGCREGNGLAQRRAVNPTMWERLPGGGTDSELPIKAPLANGTAQPSWLLPHGSSVGRARQLGCLMVLAAAAVEAVLQPGWQLSGGAYAGTLVRCA